jgi:[ribosomal protein S5]-alanine N-acetyltransferase
MILMDPLRTERLLLRSLCVGDCGAPYLDWMRDPHVQAYLESRFVAHERGSLEAFVESNNRSTHSLLLGLIERESSHHVGNVKLGPIDEKNGRASIGIMIGDVGSWGRGYASEALNAVADYAFASLGLGKLTAGALLPNSGSRRAFEKAGFEVEAILPRHALHDGVRVDVVLLGRHAP